MHRLGPRIKPPQARISPRAPFGLARPRGPVGGWMAGRPPTGSIVPYAPPHPAGQVGFFFWNSAHEALVKVTINGITYDTDTASKLAHQPTCSSDQQLYQMPN